MKRPTPDKLFVNRVASEKRENDLKTEGEEDHG